MLTINILTIFPQLFDTVLKHGLIGKALEKNLWKLNIINIRDFATDKHHSVDDITYGGGAGMLFRANVIDKAIQSINTQKIIHTSPKGRVFTQPYARELSKLNNITILSSRYEGIDQRVITKHCIEEVSIGDYILTGGEIPALVIIDTVIRLLQNVLNNENSTEEESFSNFLLEYDQFTRPYDFCGIKVPSVLLSGNHKKIYEFRRIDSINKTRIKRKDLWFKFIKHSLS